MVTAWHARSKVKLNMQVSYTMNTESISKVEC